MITTNSFHYCQVPPIIAGLTLGSSGGFFIDKIMENTTKGTQNSITVLLTEDTEKTIGEISLDLFGELEIGVNTALIAKAFLQKYNKAIEKMDQKTAIEFVNKELQKFAINILND